MGLVRISLAAQTQRRVEVPGPLLSASGRTARSRVVGGPRRHLTAEDNLLT